MLLVMKWLDEGADEEGEVALSVASRPTSSASSPTAPGCSP